MILTLARAEQIARGSNENWGVWIAPGKNPLLWKSDLQALVYRFLVDRETNYFDAPSQENVLVVALIIRLHAPPHRSHKSRPPTTGNQNPQKQHPQHLLFSQEKKKKRKNPNVCSTKPVPTATGTLFLVQTTRKDRKRLPFFVGSGMPAQISLTTAAPPPRRVGQIGTRQKKKTPWFSKSWRAKLQKLWSPKW